MNTGKKESPRHMREMEAVPWLENEVSVYKVKVGRKEERERLWGLTIQLEKLEFNSLGNGKVSSVSSGKNHVTKRTVA